jgi:hypothetical protein
LVTQVESVKIKQKELIQQYLRHTDWYKKLDEQFKEHMREHGKRLLELVIQYINKPALQEETLQAVRSWGEEVGSELAGLGLSLTDTLEAFVLHRTPILETATELIKGGQPINKRTLNAIQQINYLIDQTLLALVQGHQHNTSYE